MVRGDVADDGQAEPGAAGVAAAGAVDPVEALEDALEVAAGDADAVVAHGDVDPARRRCGPVTSHRADPGSLYFTALSSRLVTAETSWRRSPTTVSRAGGGSTSISMPRCSAAGRTRSAASLHEVAPPPTSSAARPVATSRRDSSSRSSMVLPTRNASAGQALGQAPGDVGVVLVEQRLGQQGEGPDRGLQLVADVGDEVAAHVLEPAALGGVLDDDEHARRPGARRPAAPPAR